MCAADYKYKKYKTLSSLETRNEGKTAAVSAASDCAGAHPGRPAGFTAYTSHAE